MDKGYYEEYEKNYRLFLAERKESVNFAWKN
jgi:hypothetical protein